MRSAHRLDYGLFRNVTNAFLIRGSGLDGAFNRRQRHTRVACGRAGNALQESLRNLRLELGQTSLTIVKRALENAFHFVFSQRVQQQYAAT
jgi:hypothetical protein